MHHYYILCYTNVIGVVIRSHTIVKTPLYIFYLHTGYYVYL